MINKNIFAIFCLLIVLLNGGCAASLEDFEKMSSYERSEYICKNSKHIRNLASQMNAAYKLVSESEQTLARGYKIHTSCKKVPVVKSLGEDCMYYGGFLQCHENTSVDYETVCEELPVSIDSELEKEKLQSYQVSLNRYIKQYEKKQSDCKSQVIKLNAEDAFQYYQITR